LAATADFPGSHSGRDDPRIVHDEEIVGAKQIGQVPERPVFEFALESIQDEEERGVALWGGGLGDETWRQLIVEIRGTHGLDDEGGLRNCKFLLTVVG
jgi:hypothetical protein